MVCSSLRFRVNGFLVAKVDDIHPVMRVIDGHVPVQPKAFSARNPGSNSSQVRHQEVIDVYSAQLWRQVLNPVVAQSIVGRLGIDHVESGWTPPAGALPVQER